VKKLLFGCAAVLAAASCIGFDVLSRGYSQVRDNLRKSLTPTLSLEAELAAAKASVRAFEGSIAAGEGKALSLQETLKRIETDVKAERASFEREHAALSVEKSRLESRVAAIRVSSGPGGPAAGRSPDDAANGVLVRRAENHELARTRLADREAELVRTRDDLAEVRAELSKAMSSRERLVAQYKTLDGQIQVHRVRSAVRQIRSDASGLVESGDGNEAASRVSALRERINVDRRKLDLFEEPVRSSAPVDGATAIEALDSALAPAAR
jgi:DNA repair exonuclease SbcCD ATPase subunit